MAEAKRGKFGKVRVGVVRCKASGRLIAVRSVVVQEGEASRFLKVVVEVLKCASATQFS